MAATGACSEYSGSVQRNHDDTLLQQFTVKDFEQVTVLSAVVGVADGIYVGPATFDPQRDVTAPVALSVPPTQDASDAVYETLADWHGTIDAGDACDVSIRRSQPDGPQLDFWELTNEQSTSLREGTHIVVSIEVHCE